MSSYEQIVEEMKSKRKNEWAPRGRGKQISDEKLVYEYSVLKKSVNRIAKENGWVTNTLKQRLVRLGVYVRGGQGEVKRLPKRERNCETVEIFGQKVLKKDSDGFGPAFKEEAPVENLSYEQRIELLRQNAKKQRQ